MQVKPLQARRRQPLPEFCLQFRLQLDHSASARLHGPNIRIDHSAIRCDLHLAGELRDTLADEAHAIAHGELIRRLGPGLVRGRTRGRTGRGIGWGHTPTKTEEAPEPPAQETPHHKPAEPRRVESMHKASPFLQHRRGVVLASGAVCVSAWYPSPTILSRQQQMVTSIEGANVSHPEK